MIMNSQPLVTIGVPTYNRPIGLKRALDSILHQTYLNLEIIVSDNCSTIAEVANTIKDYAGDTRFKFIFQPVNKGIINNFNFVLTESTGDYFMWLADDDWLDLNYVEECVSFLSVNPDFPAAYGMAKMYTQNGNFIGFDARMDLIQQTGKERMKFFLNNLLYNGCFSAIVRKEFKAELFMKDLIAIDWLVVLRLAFLGKFKMLEVTNKHISQGGLSASIETLTKNMPEFTKSFPSLTIAINLVVDILWGSNAYKDLNVFSKLSLARQIFFIVYKKHNIKTQLKPGIRQYIEYKKRKFF